MAENLKILVVDGDRGERSEVRKTLTRARFAVVGEAGYGAEALSLARETRPNAVLVAWAEPAVRAAQTVESLNLLFPHTPVIAYSSDQSVATVRRAVQAGVQDYLVKPLRGEEVRQSIFTALEQVERRRLAEAGDPERLVPTGTVITVFGAKGGIGKTTVATNLAVALKVMSRSSVALVDMDVRFGDVALMMNLDPETTISDLADHLGEVDRFSVSQYLTPHTSGVQVLAAPRRPADWRQITAAHMERILHVLVQTHDFVVIDTPGFFTELVATALDAANVVLMVTSLDMASIKDCVLAQEMLQADGFALERMRILVNHPAKANGLRRADIQAALGGEVFWEIPHDKAVASAGQLGEPVVLRKPTARGSRHLYALAQALSGVRAGHVQLSGNREGRETAAVMGPSLEGGA